MADLEAGNKHVVQLSHTNMKTLFAGFRALVDYASELQKEHLPEDEPRYEVAIWIKESKESIITKETPIIDFKPEDEKSERFDPPVVEPGSEEDGISLQTETAQETVPKGTGEEERNLPFVV